MLAVHLHAKFHQQKALDEYWDRNGPEAFLPEGVSKQSNGTRQDTITQIPVKHAWSEIATEDT